MVEFITGKVAGTCTDCGGELEHKWGEEALIKLGLMSCKKCRLLRISDAVSAFWEGYRKALEDTGHHPWTSGDPDTGPSISCRLC